MKEKAKREGRKTSTRGIKDMGSGVYLLRIVGRDERGRRREIERRVEAPSLRAAQEIRRKLEQELRVVDGSPKRSTLGEVARGWLEQRLGAKRPDGTCRMSKAGRERYAHAVQKMIVPFVGDTDWVQVDRGLVERWRDHLGGFYATTTVNGALSVLKTCLRDSGCTAAEAVRALEVDDTRITADEPNALDEDEVGRFVEKARELYPQHLAMILVLLTSGQRISTVLALRREDIDRTKRTINFRRRLSAGEPTPGLKRSRLSADQAPLLEVVEAELVKLWAGHDEAQRASGLAFPSEDGRHRNRGLLKLPFQRIAEAAGITKRFTPHGCRRTAAAFYRRVAGSAVSKAIVGHTTDRMHEHYAVVSMAERNAAARGAFRVLAGRRTEEVGIPTSDQVGIAGSGSS